MSARRFIVAGALAGLLGSVYAANYLIQRYGFVQVWPTHLHAPAGVYMAGMAFLFRDTVQRLASVWLALAGIACGALLSLLISPALAGASASAFALSEAAGLVVLAALGRWLVLAIVTAQLVAAVTDSLVFLWLAFGSVAFWQGQTVGKLSVLALAFPVVYAARRVPAQHRARERVAVDITASGAEGCDSGSVV